MHSRTTVIIPFCIVVLAITSTLVVARVVRVQDASVYNKVGVKYAELRLCLGWGGDLCYGEGRCDTIKLAHYKNNEGSEKFRLILPNQLYDSKDIYSPEEFEMPWDMYKYTWGKCNYLSWSLPTNTDFTHPADKFVGFYSKSKGVVADSLFSKITPQVWGLRYIKAHVDGEAELQFMTNGNEIQSKAGFKVYFDLWSTHVIVYIGDFVKEPYRSTCAVEKTRSLFDSILPV